MIYVANSYSNTVSVIDSRTNTVVSNITVGNSPDSIAINPISNRIFVVNGLAIGNETKTTISVIDGSTNKVVNVIPIEIQSITSPSRAGNEQIRQVGKTGENPER